MGYSEACDSIISLLWFCILQQNNATLEMHKLQLCEKTRNLRDHCLLDPVYGQNAPLLSRSLDSLGFDVDQLVFAAWNFIKKQKYHYYRNILQLRKASDSGVNIPLRQFIEKKTKKGQLAVTPGALLPR